MRVSKEWWRVHFFKQPEDGQKVKVRLNGGAEVKHGTYQVVGTVRYWVTENEGQILAYPNDRWTEDE